MNNKGKGEFLIFIILVILVVGVIFWSARTTGNILIIEEPTYLGKIVYIAGQTGNDMNGGLSADAPVKTFEKALSLAPDVFLFKCGETYLGKLNYQSGKSGNAITPIYFDHYGDCSKSNAIIPGGQGIDQQSYTVFFGGRHYVTVRHLEFINAINNMVNVYNSGNIKFIENIFKNNYNHAFEATLSKDVLFEGNTLDGNGYKMTATVGGGESIWVAKSSGVILKNNKVTKSGGVAMNMWHSSGVTVDGNSIKDCTAPDGRWESGIYFDGCNESIAKNNYVSGCHIGYTVNSEIAGWTSNKITFEKNIGYNNKVNLVIDNNIGGIANRDIIVKQNTFVRDVTGSGGYNNDLIIKGVDNLLFTKNIIADYTPLGYLMTFSGNGVISITDNVWFTASGKYPIQADVKVDPDFVDLVKFKPGWSACGYGAVSC